MRPLPFFSLLAFAAALNPCAAQQPAKEKRPGIFYVIDFAPVNNLSGKVKFEVTITARTVNGETVHAKSSLIIGDAGPDLAEPLRQSLKGRFIYSGWEARKISATELLVLGKAGVGIDKLDIESDGLAAGFRPVARKATAAEIKPPPAEPEVAIIDFGSLDLGGRDRSRLTLVLHTSAGDEASIQMPVIAGKDAPLKNCDRIHEALATSGTWNVGRSGNCLLIFSKDGKDRPATLTRVQVFFPGAGPGQILPTIVATDGIKIELGKN